MVQLMRNCSDHWNGFVSLNGLRVCSGYATGEVGYRSVVFDAVLRFELRRADQGSGFLSRVSSHFEWQSHPAFGLRVVGRVCVDGAGHGSSYPRRKGLGNFFVIEELVGA